MLDGFMLLINRCMCACVAINKKLNMKIKYVDELYLGLCCYSQNKN